MKTNIIYNCDCLEGMKNLPDQCVDMIITSPPYFNLRDYGTEGQIGIENDYNEYLDKKIYLEFGDKYGEIPGTRKAPESAENKITGETNNEDKRCDSESGRAETQHDLGGAEIHVGI